MANKKTILVVDDDPGARRLLQFVLAKTGCTVATASSGAEALVEVSKHDIDLLITDFMMKGLNGFELIRKLHSAPQYEKLPVIILSARWQIEYRNKAQEGELLVLMTKPFSPIELIAQVSLMLKL